MSDTLPACTNPDCPHEASKVRQRERRHECTLYLRHPGKGSRIQLRWWLGGYGSINCGLYADEWTAERVRASVLKRVTSADLNPLGLWRLVSAVLAELAEKGHRDLPTVLPKYVERKGGVFFAEVSKGGQSIALGPFSTAEAAYEAMAARVAELDATAREAHRTMVQAAAIVRRLPLTVRSQVARDMLATAEREAANNAPPPPSPRRTSAKHAG